MQWNRRVFDCIFGRRVSCRWVNLDQKIIVLEKNLGEFIDQVLAQAALADHHVPDTDGRNWIVNITVHTAGQINGHSVGGQAETEVNRLIAASAIAADLLLRFDEDMNVAMPDALRFYPAIAVLVEIALHLVPIAVLVGLLGAPTAIDITFWRIAVPVALVEAVLQAVYATSLGTSLFAAAQLLVFGVVQVWVFWRFGFVWMLGFRLAYYAAWHVAWGVVRLELLF